MKTIGIFLWKVTKDVLMVAISVALILLASYIITLMASIELVLQFFILLFFFALSLGTCFIIAVLCHGIYLYFKRRWQEAKKGA